VKAISLYQPHASGVANGCKLWETRPKPMPRTLIGRRVAIQASLRCTRKERASFDWLMEDLESRLRFEDQLEHGEFDCLPFGAVVCTAFFVRSIPTEKIVAHGLRGLELLWGNYATGRFAWEMNCVVRLTTPVPMKFHQGVNEIQLPESALADHTAAQLGEF
jgi:hypothetical protein